MGRAALRSFLSHCDIRERKFKSLLELFNLVSIQTGMLQTSHQTWPNTHSDSPQLYLSTMVFSQNIMCVNTLSTFFGGDFSAPVLSSCLSSVCVYVCDWVIERFIISDIIAAYAFGRACGSVWPKETFSCLVWFENANERSRCWKWL